LVKLISLELLDEEAFPVGRFPKETASCVNKYLDDGLTEETLSEKLL